jgi:hypothetical protein
LRTAVIRGKLSAWVFIITNRIRPGSQRHDGPDT